MYNSIFTDDKCINIEKAIKKCNKYSCVSFDVFDTLIKRNLGTPSDLFILLENEAKKIDVDDFYAIRTNSEKQLREIETYATLDDIYNQIAKTIGTEKSNILKSKEIELEISYCQPNYEIKKLFEIFRKNNKRIIAISDMYLSSNIIIKMLKKCEINVDSLYVSCEEKAHKSNSSLFKVALEKEKINKNDIIHIGDSLKADILGSKLAGMDSIHIKKYVHKYNSKRFLNKIIDKKNYNVFYQIINNNIENQDTYYSKFGFAVFGPLVYNYLVWLKKMCDDNKLKKIFFFARDGYVLKKAFDLLFDNDITTSYIYFSRRAIRIPYSSMIPTYENIMKYFPGTKQLTLKVYFENFGLNPEKYDYLIKKYNLDLNKKIYRSELDNNPIYKEIFDSIFEDIINEAKREYKIFKKYLMQESFFGDLAIVDIGWHNSMQFYLEQIAKYNNYELNMFGFYVGKMNKEKTVSFSKGYLSEIENKGYANSSSSFIGLMESVFLATEGSTKSYKESQNGKVLPDLLEYEYGEDSLEYKSFIEIQKGIIDFVSIAKKLDNLDVFCLSGEDSYMPIKSFGVNPYLNDIKKFSVFRYYSEEIVYFANPKSIFFYLCHLKQLKIDIYNARWKIGFMKELFKIPFPYYKVFKHYHK